jgi:Holliday junction resolvase
MLWVLQLLKSESKIQSEIMSLLNELGFFVIRNHTQGVRFTTGRGSNPNRGMPDLTAIKAGEVFFIEVKTPQGKLNQDQIKWHEKAYQQGVLVLVFTSVYDVHTTFNPFE